MSVSLCMIARNEEAHLDACLASVEELVDELIIVDTGSVDATKRIALAHGARVFDFPWCDDFSAARNESLRHAHGDWILWMDADDRVTAENREKLRTVLDSLPDSRDGFVMRCACSSFVTLSRTEVDHVRLFRSRSDVRFRYRVHEQVAPSILRAGGTLRMTDVVIQHVGYADAGAYRRKQERNLRLLELACQEHPLEPFMLYYRGLALLDLDRAGEALVSLILATSLMPPKTAVARLLPVHLADAYEREGMLEEAESTLRTARATYSADAALAFAEATLLYKLGRLDQAERGLTAYLADAPAAARPENFVGDIAIEAFRARHLRASLRYLLGRYRDAEEDARLVIGACPAFGDAWLVLGDSLVAQERDAEVEAVTSELESGAGGEVLSVLIRAGAVARSGNLARARALVERRIREQGSHPFLERARERLAATRLPTPYAAHCLAGAVLAGERRSKCA
jgi:tetratricopeptide (TPR) repeat protein